MKYILSEELLVEGIKEVKAKFPKIEDDKFYELIKLDPTYKDGVDSVGTYGKWILNLYNKGNLKEEDFYKVTDYLTEFEQKKKWMKVKDIGLYKTLPDLKKELDKVDIKLSKNQKEREFKKQVKAAELNADKVFESENWEVWIPKDYESSCKLASNTEWCTGPSSHGNASYYKSYSEEGPLYININKNNPDEKYQFHFPSGQFMDRYDEPVLFWNDFIVANPELEEFYTKIIQDEIQKKLDAATKRVNYETILDKMYLILDFAMCNDSFIKLTDETLSHLEFNIDAYDINYHCQNNRDMSEDFLNACMTGDLWEYFDYSDYDITEDDRKWAVKDIDDYIKSNVLRAQHHLPEDLFELLINNELPDEYKHLAGDLNLLLDKAITDGMTAGAEKNCFDDFNGAVKNAMEDVQPNYQIDNEIVFKLTGEELKERFNNIVNDYDFTPDYFSDDINRWAVNEFCEDFNFREPRGGWYDFDVDIFNQSLVDFFDDYVDV